MAKFFSSGTCKIVGNAILDLYGGLAACATGAAKIKKSKYTQVQQKPKTTEEQLMQFDDVAIGKRLFVGVGNPELLGTGEKEIRGSAYIEAPVVLGTPPGEVEAALMVGRDKNSDSNNPDRSVHIRGNQRIDGDSGTANALYVTGGGTIDSLYVDGDVFVTGKVDCGNKERLARFALADEKPKPFDLKHPSREGYRLRYACIEGPEVGVYHRGRINNSKVIELPYYWKDLVHEDSITVQLQPIGSHQDVIVKRWDDERVYLNQKVTCLLIASSTFMLKEKILTHLS